LTFSVLLHPKAARSLKKLPFSLRERMTDALRELEKNPEMGDQLVPSEYRRIRVGDHRAVYEIESHSRTIIVIHIGHRKNVYDDFSRLL
jgi:mRNA interferase RelE/StbE